MRFLFYLPHTCPTEFFESAFLSYLTGEGKQWFSIEDAYSAFPDKSEGAVRFMLMRMLDKGLLIKVSKKVYWVVPFDQNAGEFLPDWHLLAEPLSGGGRYYIGYYSALQIHGLITQPSLKEQVVREKRKTETVVLKGVEFQFIYHNDKHFFGVKKVWIDSYNKVPCSDLDFTLVDDGISNETIQDALKEVTIGLGAFIQKSNAWARVVSLGLTSFFIFQITGFIVLQM